jgi:hypothetical protein
MLAGVAAGMGQDIGLLSRKDRRQLRPPRSLIFFSHDGQSRRSTRRAPRKVLWDWEVLTIEGGEGSDAITSCEVDEIDMKAPQGYLPQGGAYSRRPPATWNSRARDLHPGHQEAPPTHSA